MRYRTLTMLLLALTLAAAACGGDGGAADADAEDAADGGTATAGDCSVEQLDLFEPGRLTIATGEPAFPPWVIDDDPANGQGYESAVAYALAEQMGFAREDVQWVRTGFDEAITPGEKPYDFNMQQYSITEERARVVDFSIPYYYEQKSVVALEGSPAASARTFADLAEARLGATVGTTDLDYIEQEIGVDNAAVYNTQADTFAALAAGQIDATVVGLATAYYVTSAEIDNATIAGVLPDTGQGEGEGMGLLFEKGSTLVECVDTALQALHDDGTIEGLVDEWLEQGGEIPEIAP